MRIRLVTRLLQQHPRARLYSLAKPPPGESATAPPPPPPPPVLEFWERLAICKTCPQSAELVKGFPTMCKECGCLIQTKAMFPIFHCPLNKW